MEHIMVLISTRFPQAAVLEGDHIKEGGAYGEFYPVLQAVTIDGELLYRVNLDVRLQRLGGGGAFVRVFPKGGRRPPEGRPYEVKYMGTQVVGDLTIHTAIIVCTSLKVISGISPQQTPVLGEQE